MPPQPENALYTHRFGEKITIENADRLIAEINQHFLLPEVKRVVLDLENVRECSSYGLRLFLIFQRKAEAEGKTLVMYRPHPVLLDLFRTTRLDHVFSIVQTLDDADGR